MGSIRQRFMYCDDCHKVVRVDLPECIHFGACTMRRNAESVTVVYRNKDGKISTPWNPDHPRVVANARKHGLERVEIRGARAVRKFERELDARDLSRHRRHMEKREQLFAPMINRARQDLHDIVREGQTRIGNQVIKVSQQGRNLAREELRRLERGYSEQNWESGNHRD
jgi:hypothetical protein